MHLDQSEIKRNREKYTLQLRKQNREEIFLKRRNIGAAKSQIEEEKGNESNPTSVVLDERYREIIQQALKTDFNKQQLQVCIAELLNANPVVKHQAVIGLRKIISAQQSQETVQLALDFGALPSILTLLKEKQLPHVRFEASWVLSNIAAGTTAHCQTIVDKGGIELLLDLLGESHFRLNEQAIWAIGNIGGDTIKFRDLVIQKQGLEVLVKLAEKSKQKCIVKRAAWAISNLCRGTPLPKFDLIKNGFATLARTVVSQILDDDELSDCLWAISSNSADGQKSRIQKLVEINNFVSILISLCKTNSKPSVRIPALRIIGNISIGNELHTEQILKGGGLQLIKQLLNNDKKAIRREACWIISNICAGTSSQIRQVLFNTDLMLQIGSMFWSDQIEVKKEICYIFRNMGHSGDKKSILEVYLKLNAIEGVVSLIRQDQDASAIETALKCLFEMLNVGNCQGGKNIVLKQLQSIPGCLERLQGLQHHNSPKVYKEVVKMFQQFFVLEDQVM